MPKADFSRYKVKAVSISPRGLTEDHCAKIGKIKDNGDGTATIGIDAHLPINGLIRIIVEVDI